VSSALRLCSIALLLLGGSGLGKEKTLTVLFTGDNSGEIAPCG
jgi:hypothetical protein